MPRSKATEINGIVARCRRIGWTVETGSGSVGWQYRILMPNGGRVQLHRSPSDVNWQQTVIRQLDAGGFTDAENAWLAADEQDRKAKIAADRAASDRKAAKLAGHAAAVRTAAGDLGIHPVDVDWMLTPTRVPQARFVLLDPQSAAKALDTVNTFNRKLRNARTEHFVAVIEAGEWGMTHQGAAFDWNGVLQDAQHRFAAIAKTGQTLPVQITIGMDPANFRKIDSPLVRTARDAAHMRGEVDVNTLTSAARLITNVKRYGPGAHTQARKHATSIDAVDATIIETGDRLRHAVARAARIYREVRVSRAAVAAAIYLIGEKLPPDDPRVEQFCEQLETGTGIDRQDPVWKLRRRLLLNSTGRGGGSKLWEVLAYTIKAWNHTAAGRQPADLVWRANEGFPSEPFVPAPQTTRKSKRNNP